MIFSELILISTTEENLPTHIFSDQYKTIPTCYLGSVLDDLMGTSYGWDNYAVILFKKSLVISIYSIMSYE
jgi:hypothetical protein